MTAPRRVRRERSETIALIFATTRQLMLDEGYAAVTTRRVAKDAGLTSALVHYYFPTTDDLLVALYRKASEDYHLRLMIDQMERDGRPEAAIEQAVQTAAESDGPSRLEQATNHPDDRHSKEAGRRY